MMGCHHPAHATTTAPYSPLSCMHPCWGCHHPTTHLPACHTIVFGVGAVSAMGLAWLGGHQAMREAGVGDMHGRVHGSADLTQSQSAQLDTSPGPLVTVHHPGMCPHIPNMHLCVQHMSPHPQHTSLCLQHVSLHPQHASGSSAGLACH